MDDGEADDPMTGECGGKRAVHGTLVKVLIHRRNDRGMRLEEFASRCVREGEVHELVTTDRCETAPGTRVDRVGFLGFAEIGCAGVLDRGDQVWIGDRLVGTLLGFDSCHFPNHYNILISAPEPVTGVDLALRPEAEVRFVPAGVIAQAGPREPGGAAPLHAHDLKETR
ncbi:DUF6917 domain-containing protein [Streptomyces gibsoniae]|uniref:DUF6917 domain-containing protein n=1 Tax=Streptomyces gibsoniae TaxID=3075529 RepID=A0ABU2TLT0_9ACTN|nr:hypothetical protein [Streptomyces sp. DSM 41699]MDT0461877.1 hypothetical protein [Streptomyces sp. DSM 41699]